VNEPSYEIKPIGWESPTKETAKTSTTNNPYLKGGVTRWPMPELLVKETIDPFPGTRIVPSKAK
jgi:hypothetical protein